MSPTKQIALILPAYKPKGTWLSRVELLVDLLSKHGSVLLLISPDGSYSDYSQADREALDTLGKRLPVHLVSYEQNRGKGYAVRSAVAQVDTADYILYTDYDIPFSLTSYERILHRLEEGADVVVGNRGRAYTRQLPPFRKFLSLGSHLLNKVLFGLPLQDTQGGIKGFNQRGRSAFLQTTIASFLFDTQFVAIAHRRGLRLEEVSVALRPDGVQLSNMGMKTLCRELKTIIQVISSRWF